MQRCKFSNFKKLSQLKDLKDDIKKLIHVNS